MVSRIWQRLTDLPTGILSVQLADPLQKPAPEELSELGDNEVAHVLISIATA